MATSTCGCCTTTSRTGWEGTGVSLHTRTPAAQALETAHQLALEQVIAADGPEADEARSALAARPG